jgi:hypothetical protein
MRMQPATRTSKPPLGGTSGAWRRRLVRFHAPLALASSLILVVFLTLPGFDVGAYSVMNTRSGAALPQELGEDELQEMEEIHRGEGGAEGTEETDGMDHSGGRTGEMNHGGTEPSGEEANPNER